MKVETQFARDSSSEHSPARVLVVAPQPFYEDRGTPIAVRHVLTALSKLGFAVDLLTFPMGMSVELPRLRIIRAGPAWLFRHVPIGFSIRKLILDVAIVARMYTLCRRERYAYIHAVEEAVLPAVVFGPMFGARVIYDMQSSLPEQLSMKRAFRARFVQAFLRRVERWMVRKADVVVCSAGLEGHVRTLRPIVQVLEWHFPSTGSNMARPHVMRLRKTIGIAPDTRIVLYTGNFKEYQGLSLLIDAVPMILAAQPNTVIVLVGGNGSGAAELPKRAKELCDRGTLIIVPRKSRSLMPLYMAIADVLVAPRDAIGNVPLKVFDYMAAGKPIVATDCPAHRAVLDDERAVLVPADPQAFAQAIVQLLADDRRARRISTAARAYVDDHLSWETFIRMVARTYTLAKSAGTGTNGSVGFAA